MKAINLPAYQGNIIRALKSLELVESDLAVPHSDEVIIQVSAAPCNPSDLAFIQGGYNIRKALPAIPGFEGAGLVVDAGEDPAAQALKGKRVSFFSQSDRGGSWATHIPVKASDCIVVGDELPPDMAACFSVNPFTAYAMVELAQGKNTGGIIQNAAGGQVASFINTLAERAGLKVINIVRKEEQVKALKDDGYKHVLWQLDPSFNTSLNKLAHSFHAQIAFDATAGELSGHILRAMPEKSTLYLYGALAARTLSEIPAADVIFNNKVVRGFNMNEWKEDLDSEAFEQISLELQKLFKNGTLKTKIQGSYKLSEYEQALMQYIRNMSGGKVLILPPSE